MNDTIISLSRKHSSVTDEALAEMLQDLPPLKPSDFPNLSDEVYSEHLKKQSGHLPKGVEKWL